MTRKSALMEGSCLPPCDLSRKFSRSMDSGAATYKSISDLSETALIEGNAMSGEIVMALGEMESVMEHLASASSGGDIEKARWELESRDMINIL